MQACRKFKSKAMRFLLCLCFFLAFFSFSGVFNTVFNTGKAYALTVTGLPEWVRPAVLRSLNAVWNEIPRNANIDRSGTLAIVASRLFAGYKISLGPMDSPEIEPEGPLSQDLYQDLYQNEKDEPVVRFIPDSNDLTRWAVKIILPDLRDMARNWFLQDIFGLEDEILRLLEPLPAMALTWADSVLEDCVRNLVKGRLPGWDFSIQITLANTSTNNANITPSNGINLKEQEQDLPVSQVSVTFRPSQSLSEPLILAIQPELYSRTLPVMFRNNLEARLIPALSPLVGVPVRWAEKHSADVEAIARGFLEDRNAVSNMRAHVNVTFVPATVSNLSARVDSDRLSFSLWVAAYAGLDERYPEAGVFFGWNTYEQTGLELELYLEGIVELKDFGWTRRVGARGRLFTLLNAEFWAGAEISWPGGDWFARVQWGPSQIRRPYFWWRWSPDVGQELAVGYLFDEHVSLEIYYNDIKDENGRDSGGSKIGLRGLWSL